MTEENIASEMREVNRILRITEWFMYWEFDTPGAVSRAAVRDDWVMVMKLVPKITNIAARRKVLEAARHVEWSIKRTKIRVSQTDVHLATLLLGDALEAMGYSRYQ